MTDPLKTLFRSSDFMEGLKQGREAGKTEAEGKPIDLKRKYSEYWRAFYRRKYEKYTQKGMTGLFGLRCGHTVLTEKFKTINEAVEARERIYKPHQRNAVEIIMQ